MIKVVLFDLGGVFFTGDFNRDFIDVIKEIGIEVSINSYNDTYVDNRLALGEIDIVEWLEEVTDKELGLNMEEKVREIWLNIWKPDPKMIEIVNSLKKNYIVSIVSNLDRLNGESYKEKGYLSYFQKPHFLSYEMYDMKPNKTVWERIVNTYQVFPEEILLIDDDMNNILSASRYGLQTMQFSYEEDIISTIEAILIH